MVKHLSVLQYYQLLTIRQDQRRDKFGDSAIFFNCNTKWINEKLNIR